MKNYASVLLLLVTARLFAAQPPVTLSLQTTEPDAAGNLRYTLIAPNDGNSTATGRYWFEVTITNSGGGTLQVNNVRADFFTGAAHVIRDFPQSPTVAVGTTPKTIDCTNTQPSDPPLPVPALSVTLSVFCDGYDPIGIQRFLAPYVPATPGGKYIYPADEGDIGPDMYFSAGNVHEPPDGQGWGADWSVYRIDVSGNATDVRDGTAGTENAHKLGWGVPMRAMADGIVLRTNTGWDDNPMPGKRAFQKMSEADGATIADAKVTHVSLTRAAVLARLSTGQVQLSVWQLANDGRQMTLQGASDLVPGELVTDMALDDLSNNQTAGANSVAQVASILRLSNGNQRVILWNIPAGSGTPTRQQVDGTPIGDGVSLATMSATHFATGVRSTTGSLRVTIWEVDGTGAHSRASGSAGTASSVCTTALSATRVVSSIKNASGLLQVIVWDFIDPGNGTYSLLRRNPTTDTADAISRVAACIAFKNGWTRNRWVTAVRTEPAHVLKLLRWDASDDGATVTHANDLDTLTTQGIDDTALAIAVGNGADGGDNAVTASVVPGSFFKINGWGDPDKDPGVAGLYEQQAENFPVNGNLTVDRVSLDQLDKAQYFVAARTTGGALKLMTWQWATGGGNCVYVLYGDCRAFYGHFQNNIDTSAIYPGAAIKAGQMIGRMGNSGSAGDVHTHIDVQRISPDIDLTDIPALLQQEDTGGVPTIGARPIPFSGARAMQLDAIQRGGEGNVNNSFTTMNGHGVLAPMLGIRPRVNTRYVVPGLGNIAPNGLKEPLMTSPPLGGPHTSIAQALGNSSSGTRLYIRGGNYFENLTFTTPMTIRRYDYYDASGPVLIQR